MAVHTDEDDRRVPDEIGGWNWGAFLLNWVWGVGNNTYVALLTLVPFFGTLAMPFVLGAKGDAWAWRNGRWDSVAHFRRVQRRWAVWGFVIVGATVCLVATIVGGVFYAFATSDAYRMAVARVGQDRAAVALLGTPISAGFPIGTVSVSGSSGEATLGFSVTGSKASGRVVVQARRSDGVWSLTLLRLFAPGRSGMLDLLGPGDSTSRQLRAARLAAAE